VPFLPSVPSRRLPLLVVLGIFAALAEFERELISERTIAGLASARARGRKGGRPFKMTPAKLRLATASMGRPDTRVGALCAELGITRQTSTSPRKESSDPTDYDSSLGARRREADGTLSLARCARLVFRGVPTWHQCLRRFGTARCAILVV